MAEFQIYWVNAILWIKRSVCSIYNVRANANCNENFFMHNFIKPNKFKIRFTEHALLYGGFAVGLILNMLGYFEFMWIGSQNVFLNIIHNSVTNLFSHFIFSSYSDCWSIISGCFFLKMFKLLVLQSIIFFLLGCSLYQKNWKIRFWRIYFFLLTVIHLHFYSYILSSPGKSGFNPNETYLDILITTIALLGLFLFAAEKKFIGPIFWKLYFFVYISWDIIIRVTLKPFILVSVIHGFILLIPLYLALYLYGFKTLKYKILYSLNKKQ